MKRQQAGQATIAALPAATQIACYATAVVAVFAMLWFSTRNIATTLTSTPWQVVPMSGVTSSDPVMTPTAKPTSATQDASKRLLRLAQLNPAQYTDAAEYEAWAEGACSTAAMTEVLNAYGHHYRIADVLHVEARIGAITPDLGLTTEAGIKATATQFGFATRWGHNLTLDQVIATANSGTPVIISFPPGASSLFPPGHILVVTGGNESRVYLADSSSYNLTGLSRQQFSSYWRGFSAILTPQGA
jgi:hypothetical protein